MNPPYDLEMINVALNCYLIGRKPAYDVVRKWLPVLEKEGLIKRTSGKMHSGDADYEFTERGTAWMLAIANVPF